MSELPPAPSPRPRRTRWILLGVVAALWAGAAVAVVVVTRRDDAEATGSFTPSTHADLTQLRYVIGDLPEGFVARSAVSAEAAAPPKASGIIETAPSAMYGTPDDPSAPRVWITTDDQALEPGFDQLGITTGVVESEVDGRRAACGNFEVLAEAGAGPSQVWCYVDTEPGLSMVRTEGVGLADTVAMLQGLTFEGDEPRLEPTVLPPTMTLIESFGSETPPMYATTLVQYAGPCVSTLRLTVAWADELDLSTIRLDAREWTIVDIDGATGYLAVGERNTALVVWEADGRAYQLSVMSDGEVDLVAMARSVHAPSTDEWTAATTRAPAPGLPSLSPSATTRTVDALQVTDESGEGGTVQMQSSIGDSGVATVEWVGDRAVVTGADGASLWECRLPFTMRMEPTGSTVVDGERRATGVIVLVNGHGPRYLDVTSTDGTVVHTEIVPLPGSTDGHVAIVELPDGFVAAATVTDTLGTVIQTL
jgi:hypothetical protein